MDFLTDPRFAGIEPFKNKVWLSSPTMHGDEQRWVDEAIQTNWVSTVGANIDAVEKEMAAYLGCKYAVGLSCGTASLHLATKLAGERLYGQAKPNAGTLAGHKVFCSDVTFDASINPVAYEDGEAVFIDTERETWNMSPEALEKAFELYPEVKLIVVAHLYGTPGKIDEIRRIADAHGALIVEDAAESLGATYKGIQTGLFGDYGCISFNGNKVITGSAGGLFLTNSKEDADKVRKWSTQSREAAPWYQHEEIGYNYRMSNIVAGVVRGQIPYLDEHIGQKKEIYRRYRDGLKDLPVSMNPFDAEKSKPNFWLSCMLIDENAMAPHVRGEQDELWKSEPGKSSPGEILAAIAAFGAEGRPIWKPMHCQPIYRTHAFITTEGNGRGRSNAYIAGSGVDVKKYGGMVEAALSYTTSPVHNEEYFVKKAVELEQMGADTICIKDMANLLLPTATYSLVEKLKKTITVPIHLHTHNTTGTGSMVYMAAAMAGVDIVDCALSPFANGTSQPGTESLVAALRGTERDTGLDLEKLSKAAGHFKTVAAKMEKEGIIDSKVLRVDPNTLLYQVPGGMLSNLISQLKNAGAEDRYEEVLVEVPRVRADFGYPPLVTPTSQIVGSQAVLNVLMGRYKSFTKESKALLKGEYGALPGQVNEDVRRMVIEDEEVITCRPADHLKPEIEKIMELYGDIAKTDEDLLSCALFPQVAPEYIRKRDDLIVHEIDVEWTET